MPQGASRKPGQQGRRRALARHLTQQSWKNKNAWAESTLPLSRRLAAEE